MIAILMSVSLIVVCDALFQAEIVIVDWTPPLSPLSVDSIFWRVFDKL
jgi:hypothetical protein